jgi:ribonuclease HI
VYGHQGAVYKGFATRDEALRFLQAPPKKQSKRVRGATGKNRRPIARRTVVTETDYADRIVIYTDGSSLGNPGPGGYGVVIPRDRDDRELSGGFRKTTNNRMELLACIVGLEQFPEPSAVALHSDSRYVVDGITKGWAKAWQLNNWRKSNGGQALNIDLWQRLLQLCDRHDVHFIWVKGHAGNPGNERCDQLATQAAARNDLPVDEGYEGAAG